MRTLRKANLEVALDCAQTMQIIVQCDRVLVQDDVRVEYGVPVGKVMP